MPHTVIFRYTLHNKALKRNYNMHLNNLTRHGSEEA